MAGLELGDCSDSNTIWSVEPQASNGLMIRHAEEPTLCLQAGLRQLDLEPGDKMRLMPCDEASPLQMFVWDDFFGGPMSLVNYPTLCVVYRGVTQNPGDPIILVTCDPARDGWNGDAI
jgi:hypothetical protein